MFVQEFLKGREHDVTEECAKQAKMDGAAVSVEDLKAELPQEPAQPGKPGEPEGNGQETPAASLPPAPASRQTKRQYVQGKARVIAVNDAWRLAPWADILYACDGRWWRHHKGVPEFTGSSSRNARPRRRNLGCAGSRASISRGCHSIRASFITGPTLGIRL